MSLDIKKFKKILQKNEITIINYYRLDGKCALIKAFLNNICEFLLIYVSTKIRFEIEGDNVYDITELDDSSDNDNLDDYSNNSKLPNMEKIDEEKSLSKYNELTKKYKINISLEDSDEPAPRKMKRQITRLKIPFSSLQYDIAIHNNKYIGASFGDSISIYNIKNYNSKNSRQIMYLSNITDLIENIEEVNDNIQIIKTQFYDILKNVSSSNFNSFSSENKKYQDVSQNILLKKNDYLNSIDEYKKLYQTIKQKEDILISNYQKMVKTEDSLKRSSLEQKYQKEMNELFYTKNDIVKKGVLLISKYHKIILITEEVSFDNSIMIERVNKNYELLKEIS
jgi:hypothetical protein